MPFHWFPAITQFTILGLARRQTIPESSFPDTSQLLMSAADESNIMPSEKFSLITHSSSAGLDE